MINIDWSPYLKLKRSRVLRAVAPLLLGGQRLTRFRALAGNIMVHDLSKGVPFESASVDVVYHSHFLEHLDRDIAETFLLEVKRVLKPGGIQRIVVPDFEKACRAYIEHVNTCAANPREAEKHDTYIAALIEQSVRRHAYGTSQQSPGRRYLENLLLGDARRRGETHQWAYDCVNLSEVLLKLGFRNPQRMDYDTSLIPDWMDYGLDMDDLGREYKPESLYMEVQR